MRLPGCFRHWSYAIAALALGCQPSIGDSCKLHTDCSATGNRICEPNLPGGYCTIFNCDPGGCPSEAVCVAYGASPSIKPECAVQQSQRLERTFCMKSCASNSDCRSDYACVHLGQEPEDNPWAAAVVDLGRGDGICTIPVTKAAQAATTAALNNSSSEVCSPPLDASFPPVPDAAPTFYDASPARPADASRGGPADAARDAETKGDAAVPRRDASGAPDARGTP